MPSPFLPDRRDTGNWLDRRETDASSFRDRFSGTIQDVCGGLAIIAFLTAALIWLPACESHDMSLDEAIAISAVVAGEVP